MMVVLTVKKEIGKKIISIVKEMCFLIFFSFFPFGPYNLKNNSYYPNYLKFR